jgi:hypothetical protein
VVKTGGSSGKERTMDLEREVFALGAKAGCLEGFLYGRPKVEEAHMEDWVGNIERMAKALPPEVLEACRTELNPILRNILMDCERLLGPGHGVLKTLRRLLKDEGR